MADNVYIDTGTSLQVATDDDGTAQVQWVKVKYGDDGSFTSVDTANGFPVQILSLPSFAVGSAVTISNLATTPLTVSGTTIAINYIANTVTGIIDAIDTATELTVAGLGSVGIQIVNSGGAWAGTLQFDGTIDGTTWSQIRAVQYGGTLVGGTTVNGLFFAQVGGLLKVRVIGTAWTSGTAGINMNATAATNATTIANSLPVGTNEIGGVKITSSAGSAVESASMFLSSTDYSYSQTNVAMWTPATGKRYNITDIFVSANSTGNLTFFENTNSWTNRVANFNLAIYGGAHIPFRKPVSSLLTNSVLKFSTSTVAGGSITVVGFESA